MVQEGITNILKHSDANRVEIQVNLGKNRVKASVRDNGRGFTLTGDNEGGNHLEAGGLGFGLEGLRDRISLVRGTMKIESPPGGGTSLQADIPREPAALIDFDDRSQSEDSSAEGVRND
jgi:signal transduction histidine kinase